MTNSIFKLEKDFAPEVDALLPVVETHIKNGQVQTALDALLALEKQTRSGADMVSNGRILVSIVKSLFQAGNLTLLQENIILLSKKHGLIKQAVTKMIQEAITYVDKITDYKLKLEYIDTLRTVTAGKIYVEVEGARLTRTLAKIREDEGKINEAADILQELQVETFGSMERREKTEFILEQMRLNLARKDFIRAQIISRKISTKYFENEEVMDLKLKYYEFMIQHALNDQKYLDICKYYREVYDTKSIKDVTSKWTEILQLVVVFIILSPFDNNQSDLINRIALDKKLDSLPLFKQLLKSFLTPELMRWPMVEQAYRNELQKLYVFDPKTPEGIARWQDLHNRVIEHNIRVVAKYYDRITLKRLTELLDLSAKETELFLSKLVVSKTIYARIDRVDGMVTFNKPRTSNEIVDNWSNDVNELLKSVAESMHLISKEEMVHTIAKVGTSV